MKVLLLTFKYNKGYNLARALEYYGHSVVVDGVILNKGNPLIKLCRVFRMIKKHRKGYQAIIFEDPSWDALVALGIGILSGGRSKLIFYSKGYAPASLSEGIPWIFRVAGLFILRQSILRADYIVYISEWLKNEFFTKSGISGIKDKPFRIIHHAPAPFFLEQAGTKDNGKVEAENVNRKIKLCYAGRFSPWGKSQGVILLFDAIALTIANHPDISFSLYVAGDGKYLSLIQKKAAEMNLEEYVTFTGKLDWKELRDLYLSCDVFIYPSFQDSISSVVMEAAVCGLPSIVTDSCGAVELVNDGVTGIICDPNEDALYRAIMELVLDPMKRKTMGHEAKMHISNNFSWDACASKFNDVLSTISPTNGL